MCWSFQNTKNCERRAFFFDETFCGLWETRKKWERIWCAWTKCTFPGVLCLYSLLYKWTCMWMNSTLFFVQQPNSNKIGQKKTKTINPPCVYMFVCIQHGTPKKEMATQFLCKFKIILNEKIYSRSMLLNLKTILHEHAL